jgi:hypothetical protein
MGSDRRFLYPLMILFSICLFVIISAGTLFTKWDIDRNVLIVANSLFFIVGMLVFYFQRKALQHSNPNVFIRSVMGGMMVKMLVCVVAIGLYVFLINGIYNKAAIFGSMFLYLLYLGVEVSVLMKLNKEKNA